MKKLIAIAAMAMLVGVTVGRAQTTYVTQVTGPSIVLGPASVDMKVKLTGATKLTAPTVSGLEWARVQDQVVSGTTTSTVTSDVYGTSILDILSSTTGAVVNGTATVSVVTEISTDAWIFTDTPIDLGKGKFAEAGGAANFGKAGAFGSSNTECYITGTVKDPEISKGGSKAVTTNVTAKVSGVWQEGVSSFSASISPAKASR
jgi:hypothetical protein